MKVLKFGGTSVGSAQCMKDVAKLICDGNRKIVVLSAMAGTTNTLVEISDYLYKKNTDGARETIGNLERKYNKVIDELYSTDEYKQKTLEVIKGCFDHIRSFTKDLFTLFEEKVIDFDFEENRVKKIITDKREIETDTVILAIGHSARDTFEVLYSKKLKMERKNFSVGVRIEHKQSMINEAQYGNKSKLKLPVAEYKLAYHNKDTGRSCYTFCMCPGGYVMASSSEEGTIVTNGMSRFARDGENANSAVLVNVTPNDFDGDNPLAGLEFQKDLEQKAFALGGSNYYAPIQRVRDFLENKKTEMIGEIKPTYKPGVTFANLNDILPSFVSDTLKEGIKYFDNKLKGFADDDAIMTGVETRSSSPVKIVRDDSLQSETVKGLYPCGEGPGYAGGIMSAAVDGIKCAIAILEQK